MRNAKDDLAVCEQATPGPWEVCLGSGINLCTALHSHSNPGKLICDFLPDYFLNEGYANEDHVPDMKFVEMAREALPYWINQAKALEEENKRLRALLKLARTGRWE